MINQESVSTLKNLKGKHIKSLLTKIESLQDLTPTLRKIVLDELNDLMREVMKELGYTEE